jgi:predicted transcriptional regulator
MAPKPTSITLDEQTRERLDRVAKAYERKRSWIIARAIQEYLDREEAFARAVEAGIESAGRGELIAHEDVMAEMDALIDELAPPKAKRAASKRSRAGHK